MNSTGITVVLLVLIVVTVMATNGELGKIVKAAFG